MREQIAAADADEYESPKVETKEIISRQCN